MANIELRMKLNDLKEKMQQIEPKPGESIESSMLIWRSGFLTGLFWVYDNGKLEEKGS